MKSALLLSLFTLIGTQIFAQNNIVFDSRFNSNFPHSDGALPTDFSQVGFGDLKQLNDSMFIYYRNSYNWNTTLLRTEAYAKTIHTDGSVTVSTFLTQDIDCGQYGPGINAVTDIVTSGNRVFVIQNHLYDDKGSNKGGILLSSYDYLNGSLSASSWGSDTFKPIEYIRDAKGAMHGNDLILIYPVRIGNIWQVGASSASSSSGTISFTTNTTLTSNPAGMGSEISEILSVSASELYIADNAYTIASNSYNDRTRILKFNPSTFSLSSDYSNGTPGISAILDWNTQINTPNVQNTITGLTYSNGKIIVAGHYNHYDGSPYNLGRGRVSRLNADGSIDYSFASGKDNSGIFAPNFSTSYFAWWFTDIDTKPNGKLFVSAYGIFGTNSPQNPQQCFFLQLDSLGNLDTSIGNAGKLFESQLYSNIRETIILPGATELQDQFVFNGLSITDPDPFNGTSETTLGRLVWSNNGGPSSIESINTTSITLYPNPSNAFLNIQLESEANIQIISMQGKLISSYSGSDNYQLDISNLISGLYFIKLENGRIEKFIKN